MSRNNNSRPGWLDPADATDREHFIQQCIAQGIMPPQNETQFHAARMFIDKENKSVYVMEQWTDYLKLNPAHLFDTAPPPSNAMLFEDCDGNAIMANPLQREDGKVQCVHTFDLAQFHAGKEQYILSSQGTDSLKTTLENALIHGKFDLLRKDLFQIKESGHNTTILARLSSVDGVFYHKGSGFEGRRTYGANYDSDMAPYEAALKQAVSSTKLENEEEYAHYLRINQEFEKIEGYTESLALAQKIDTTAVANGKEAMGYTKGQTLAGFLKAKNVPDDRPISMTDDKPAYLDSILKHCHGRNLYCYLTDTKSIPATIVRYAPLNPSLPISEENPAGPVGTPMRISDFVKLDKLQRIHADLDQLATLTDENSKKQAIADRAQQGIAQLSGRTFNGRLSVEQLHTALSLTEREIQYQTAMNQAEIAKKQRFLTQLDQYSQRIKQLDYTKTKLTRLTRELQTLDSLTGDKYEASAASIRQTYTELTREEIAPNSTTDKMKQVINSKQAEISQYFIDQGINSQYKTSAAINQFIIALQSNTNSALMNTDEQFPKSRECREDHFSNLAKITSNGSKSELCAIICDNPDLPPTVCSGTPEQIVKKAVLHANAQNLQRKAEDLRARAVHLGDEDMAARAQSYIATSASQQFTEQLSADGSNYSALIGTIKTNKTTIDKYTCELESYFQKPDIRVQSKNIIARDLIIYIDTRNQLGDYKTHNCFGKGVGFHKNVKIGAANALLDLLKGENSILTYAGNNKDQIKKRDLYINALSQNRIGKMSELCKTVTTSAGLPEDIRKGSPKQIVNALIIHTAANNIIKRAEQELAKAQMNNNSDGISDAEKAINEATKALSEHSNSYARTYLQSAKDSLLSATKSNAAPTHSARDSHMHEQGAQNKAEGAARKSPVTRSSSGIWQQTTAATSHPANRQVTSRQDDEQTSQMRIGH